MKKPTVSVCKPAEREFKELPEQFKKAFRTYIKETLEKGEPTSLETLRFKSVDPSIVEVKVKGRPAGRMFHTKSVNGHIQILAFATKSRNGQDPKIKSVVEGRFKAFKQ